MSDLIPMPSNTYRTIARVFVVFTILFIIGIFVPSWAGIDGFNGGFALSTFSGFFAMGALVTVFVYGRLTKVQDRLLGQGEFLAHWSYSDEEWQTYTREEHAANKKEKTGLFLLVSGFAVFFGILWPIFDHKAGLAVSAVMAGLIALIGLVACLSVWLSHRRNLKRKGEVFIGDDGAFVNGQIHAWKMLGGRLEGVAFREGKPARIEIDYSTPGGKGRQSYTARIPVPAGREDEGQKIVNALVVSEV